MSKSIDNVEIWNFFFMSNSRILDDFLSFFVFFTNLTYSNEETKKKWKMCFFNNLCVFLDQKESVKNIKKHENWIKRWRRWEDESVIFYVYFQSDLCVFLYLAPGGYEHTQKTSSKSEFSENWIKSKKCVKTVQNSSEFDPRGEQL